MYILILLLPLLSFIISGLFGRFVGSIGARGVTTLLIGFSWLVSIFIFYEVALLGSVTYIDLFTWINSSVVNVSFGLQFDSVTATMLIVVSTVSTLVHLYSSGYMSHDPHIQRFMSYLSLFTFFMFILVTADNYIQLFIGWEGVGLCSYLLINFWFTRIQANKSAIQAMVVNRVGDLGVALAMFTLIYEVGSLDFSVVFSVIPYVEDNLWSINVVTLIGIFLLIGAVGKSAQIGLHTWLPQAMEGPTPVSALIHAATMVTAGVFLLIRSSPLLEFSNTALNFLIVVGALTAFFAATVGLVQNDIKRVIAYSTCSQLGYMVFACGISNYAASLFHLMNHAFFKALLFLSAGAVIHAIADEQDMRKMGGLLSSLPYTYSLMFIASLSLMGFPFLTGYYSKDAILELTFASYTISSTFAYWLGTISAFFTAYYSMRLLYLTFINNPQSSQSAIKSAHESPWTMSIPLFILSIGSIFVGYIFKDMFIGVGSGFFNTILVLPDHVSLINAEFLSPIIKFTPVAFSILGAFVSLYLYSTSLIEWNFKGSNVYKFLSNKWHFDYIYNNYIVKNIFLWGHNVSYKILDKGLIEKLGPSGISSELIRSTVYMSKIHSGEVSSYAGTILIFTAIFIATPLPIELLILIPTLIIVYNRKW